MNARVIPEETRGKPSGGNFLLLLFALLITASMIFFTLSNVLKKQLETPLYTVRYGEIPLSEHARVDHADEKWNATSITQYFDSGKCVPIEYLCEDQDLRVAYCEMNGKKSIGLLIGKTVNKIVTGFIGNTTYWKNRCQ